MIFGVTSLFVVQQIQENVTYLYWGFPWLLPFEIVAQSVVSLKPALTRWSWNYLEHNCCSAWLCFLCWFCTGVAMAIGAIRTAAPAAAAVNDDDDVDWFITRLACAEANMSPWDIWAGGGIWEKLVDGVDPLADADDGTGMSGLRIREAVPSGSYIIKPLPSPELSIPEIDTCNKESLNVNFNSQHIN